MQRLAGLIIIASSLLAIAASAETEKLKIYGFFDLETEVSNQKNTAEAWTFDQHHLNVISIYRIDSRFRVFAEIEYEHGPFIGDEIQGNIYLANAYLEYKHSDAFQIRAGSFVTPFGIYNEIHDATPSIISTLLPHPIYGDHQMATGVEGRLFAKLATGIQFRGQIFPGDWEISYRLYVSNGRGPMAAEQDDNTNKGLGARFILVPPIQDLRLGTSMYADKNGLDGHTRQATLGFDAEFDFSAVHIEAEMLLYQMEQVDSLDIPNGVYNYGRGWTALVSYRLIDRLTPFFRLEFDHHHGLNKYHGPDGNTDDNCLMTGVNYAVTPKVYLKSEVHFMNFSGAGDPPYELFVASVAVAF